MSRNSKIVAIICCVIIGLIVLSMIVFLSVDLTRDPVLTIENNVLKVSDTYAKNISLDGAEITVIDKVPKLSGRIIGTSVGNLKKGRYKLSSGEEVYLSLVRADMKCILIDNGNKYYINCKDEDSTLSLYEKLTGGYIDEDEH